MYRLAPRAIEHISISCRILFGRSDDCRDLLCTLLERSNIISLLTCLIQFFRRVEPSYINDDAKTSPFHLIDSHHYYYSQDNRSGRLPRRSELNHLCCTIRYRALTIESTRAGIPCIIALAHSILAARRLAIGTTLPLTPYKCGPRSRGCRSFTWTSARGAFWNPKRRTNKSSSKGAFADLGVS